MVEERAKTLSSTGSGIIGAATGTTGGVRDRKRRELRQRLSDTATRMFLEHGYDSVRVSDVAHACGVSTKTVWNHFPTKDALLFDRGEALAEALTGTAGSPAAILEAVMDCIRTEVDRLDHSGPAATAASDSEVVQVVRAFAVLVDSNPPLRAAAADQVERLTQLAATALAADDRSDPDSPHNQIRAGALISLWRVHLSALFRHATAVTPLGTVKQAALDDVARGYRLVAPLFAASAQL